MLIWSLIINTDQLSQRRHIVRRFLAHVPHIGEGDFADINITMAVHSKAMRRHELAGTSALVQVAEADQRFSLVGQNRQSGPEIWNVTVYVHRRAELSDIEQRIGTMPHT